uniref:Uncharacterized protein n=1 Tax=Oryza sativa subsp. japonica TaxID=39947 RepID=Q2QVC9_ORYSJ|nr:hypothetical protein LOC_Os12g13240 [Oryza sativa Japonica Group]
MWTQVGSIVFLVYATIPISSGLISVEHENGAVTTTRNGIASAVPPVPMESRVPTTTSEKQPQAARTHPSDGNQAPTRTARRRSTTWCVIHKTANHSLMDYKVVQHVRAELEACEVFNALHQPGPPGVRSTSQEDMSSRAAKSSLTPPNLRAVRSNNDEFKLEALQRNRARREPLTISWDSSVWTPTSPRFYTARMIKSLQHLILHVR